MHCIFMMSNDIIGWYTKLANSNVINVDVNVNVPEGPHGPYVNAHVKAGQTRDTKSSLILGPMGVHDCEDVS